MKYSNTSVRLIIPSRRDVVRERMVKKVESLRLEQAKVAAKAKVTLREHSEKPGVAKGAPIERIKVALERHREANGKVARVKELAETRRRKKKGPA